MNRLYLELAVALITFVVGVGSHRMVVSLAEVALPYDTIVFEERKSSASDSSETEESSWVYRSSIMIWIVPNLVHNVFNSAESPSDPLTIEFLPGH